jgi:hypothetical protein
MAAVGWNYQLQTCCYTPTQISLNDTVWQVTAVTGGTDIPVQAVADAMNTVFAASYKNWMAPQSSWRGTAVRWVSATGITQASYVNVSSDGVGTAAGNTLPAQVSGLVSWKTALAGRRYRGRIFVGFPSDNWTNADGTMSAAGQTELATIQTLYTVPIVVAPAGGVQGITLALYMRSLLAVGPPRTYSYFPVTQGIARARWASQRRRGQYGRQNVLPF